MNIDQSFIQDLPPHATEGTIVASIISLAHAFGMSVAAEGVETESQLDQLVTNGCDHAQGFVFASAGTPEAIEDRVLRPASRSAA